MEEKYRLPWNHEAIQAQTPFELLISFWEDYYLKNQVESHRTEDGEVMLETGDPMIDKWERELADGLEPDLFENMDAEYKERILGTPSKSVETGEAKRMEEEFGFSEDYSSMTAELQQHSIGNRARSR